MVYGDPGQINIKENFALTPSLSSYSCSKISCENLLNRLSVSHKFPSITLRISGIVENKDNLLNKTKQDLLKNKTIKIYGKKNLVRDYIFIQDLFDLLNKLINKKIYINKNYIFNFSSIQNYSIFHIVKIMKKKLKSKSKISIVKNKIVRKSFSMNINSIKKFLGFRANNLNQNINFFINEN